MVELHAAAQHAQRGERQAFGFEDRARELEVLVHLLGRASRVRDARVQLVREREVGAFAALRGARRQAQRVLSGELELVERQRALGVRGLERQVQHPVHQAAARGEASIDLRQRRACLARVRRPAAPARARSNRGTRPVRALRLRSGLRGHRFACAPRRVEVEARRGELRAHDTQQHGPRAMLVLLRHRQPLVERGRALAPRARMQRRPGAEEERQQPLVGIARGQRDRAALVAQGRRLGITRLQEARVRQAHDVQRDHLRIAALARRVDRFLAGAHVLQLETAQVGVPVRAVAARASSQPRVLELPGRLERAVDRDQAALAIDPVERAREVEQSVHARFDLPELARRVDERVERRRRAFHVAHRAPREAQRFERLDRRVAAQLWRELGRERERVLELCRGLAVGIAARIVLGSEDPVAQRALEIAAVLEVVGELGGDLHRARAVEGLAAPADALVQAQAPRGGDALVHDARLQSVLKGEARGDAAVGEVARAGRVQDLRAARELVAALLDLDRVALQTRGDGGARELDARDRGGLERAALCLVEARELQLEDLADAARNVALERVEIPGERHARRLSPSRQRSARTRPDRRASRRRARGTVDVPACARGCARRRSRAARGRDSAPRGTGAPFRRRNRRARSRWRACATRDRA